MRAHYMDQHLQQGATDSSLTPQTPKDSSFGLQNNNAGTTKLAAARHEPVIVTQKHALLMESRNHTCQKAAGAKAQTDPNLDSDRGVSCRGAPDA